MSGFVTNLLSDDGVPILLWWLLTVHITASSSSISISSCWCLSDDQESNDSCNCYKWLSYVIYSRLYLHNTCYYNCMLGIFFFHLSLLRSLILSAIPLGGGASRVSERPWTVCLASSLSTAFSDGLDSSLAYLWRDEGEYNEEWEVFLVHLTCTQLDSGSWNRRGLHLAIVSASGWGHCLSRQPGGCHPPSPTASHAHWHDGLSSPSVEPTWAQNLDLSGTNQGWKYLFL